MKESQNQNLLEGHFEKPPFLYHGSALKDIEELFPRRKLHSVDDGELIYATQDMSLASVFLTEGAHYGCGKFGDVSYAWIIGDRDEFIRNDKGGHIYVLSSESFLINQDVRLKNYEYVSKKSVKPLQGIEYLSALDAMLENDVQVYFIDKAVYERIRVSQDHGYSIFQSLQSENQKRGVNVRELPPEE